MKRFIRLQELKIDQILSVAIFSVLMYIFVMLSNTFLLRLIFTLLALLFAFRQFFIFGYKINQQKLSTKISGNIEEYSVVITGFIEIKKIVKADVHNEFVYFYFNSEIVNRVYSIFEIFQFKNLKIKLEKYLKDSYIT